MTGPDGSVVRVVVVDDQTAIREALATVLDIQPGLSVVGTAADGAAAVEVVATTQPDVVLMDLNMPVLDGVGATAQIAERFPDVAVVVLTTFADEASILAALGAGARGYLTKEAGRVAIAEAVRAAATGQGVLDPAVQRRLVAAATQSATGQSGAADPPSIAAERLPVDLTPRERDVLGLIGAGLSNRAIARALFISEATVKTHINNLFAKAELADRGQAVRYALTHGVEPPPQ
jgi:DNA-binding NarL/FixJ family response regulator